MSKMWGEIKMAVKKEKEPMTIDRNAQKKNWFNQFFDSSVLKIIGVAWLFIFVLLIVFSICVIKNHYDFANQIWDLTEKLILLVFGAMFSAVGIKIESSL